jgi:hypothetical protein
MLCIAMELMTSTGALSFLSILVAVIVVVVSYFGLARASSSCWKGIETGGFPAAEIDAYRKGLHVTISTKFGGSKNSLVYERAKQATTYLRDIGVKVYNPNTAIDEGLWDDGKGGNAAWLLHFREDGLLETLKAKGFVLQLQTTFGEKSDMQKAEEGIATEIGKSGVPVIGISGVQDECFGMFEREILFALDLAHRQWKSGKICNGVQSTEDVERYIGLENAILYDIYNKMKEETDKCP